MEFIIYTIIPFVALSAILYFFRTNVKLLRPLATLLLFCFFFLGIISFLLSLGDFVMWNSRINENTNIKTRFHSESFLRILEENSFLYFLICILLTLVFRRWYLKILKLETKLDS